MKRNQVVLLLLVSLLVNVFLGVLFFMEKSSTRPYEQQFTLALMNAADNFEAYISKGNQEYYIYGVANVNTALRMTFNFKEKSVAFRNNNYISEIYGYMVVAPQRIQPYISQIAKAFRLLAENSNNHSGYQKIQEVLNILRN